MFAIEKTKPKQPKLLNMFGGMDSIKKILGKYFLRSVLVNLVLRMKTLGV